MLVSGHISIFKLKGGREKVSLKECTYGQYRKYDNLVGKSQRNLVKGTCKCQRQPRQLLPCDLLIKADCRQLCTAFFNKKMDTC